MPGKESKKDKSERRAKYARDIRENERVAREGFINLFLYQWNIVFDYLVKFPIIIVYFINNII